MSGWAPPQPLISVRRVARLSDIREEWDRLHPNNFFTLVEFCGRDEYGWNWYIPTTAANDAN